MKNVIVAMAIFLTMAVNASADDTCKSRAADKKLAGAAMTSFMTKCQKDATAACDTAAASKKLAGAAKASFSKKCVNDAVGG